MTRIASRRKVSFFGFVALKKSNSHAYEFSRHPQEEFSSEARKWFAYCVTRMEKRGDNQFYAASKRNKRLPELAVGEMTLHLGWWAKLLSLHLRSLTNIEISRNGIEGERNYLVPESCRFFCLIFWCSPIAARTLCCCTCPGYGCILFLDATSISISERSWWWW